MTPSTPTPGDACAPTSPSSTAGPTSRSIQRRLHRRAARGPGSAGAFVVAYLNGEPIGCGAVKHRPGGPSDIKRMDGWLGRRLLTTLEQLARDSGAGVVQLETTTRSWRRSRCTWPAIRGYTVNDEPFAHHWFAKALA